MGYPPRIESDEFTSFITTRCENSRLWFVNNKKLEERILAYVAKYASVYGVALYALAIEGNHIHILAHFPLANRAKFMKALNSIIAKLVNKHCSTFIGGRLWERRYSYEIVPQVMEDIEDRFFYTVLQPVQDGIARKLSEYKSYNCFHDAVHGKSRDYKIVDWTKYNRARRGNKKVSVKDFEESYSLNYSRIPGYESYTQKEYSSHLSKELEVRRQKAVAKRLSEGKGYATADQLKKTPSGALPKSTKKSERYSFRPRVLSLCPLRRAQWHEFFFDCWSEFKLASDRLRRGILDAVFPPGMYKPSMLA